MTASKRQNKMFTKSKGYIQKNNPYKVIKITNPRKSVYTLPKSKYR